MHFGIQQLLTFIFFITLALSNQENFSYHTNYGGGRIRLSHAPILSEIEGGYTRLVQIGDGHTTEVGAPEIPLFTTFYQLDPSKTYEFNFEILDHYTIENINILPHQGMEKWEVEQVSIIDENIYNSFSAYPEEHMIISDRIQGRGVEFMMIQIIPYKYYPRYNKLEVFTDIDIQITEVDDNPDITLVQSKRSHIFDEYYKDLIVNFEYSNRPDDYQASTILYIAGEDWLENSYVQDLLLWRHKQGYIVHAVSTSEIGASNGNEVIIRNYIQQAYEEWENPPEIVGLIGDTDVIDCFYQDWGTGGWNYYNGSTDFDYGQLVGNDLIPEVFVGRISAQSNSTMDNVINKTARFMPGCFIKL